MEGLVAELLLEERELVEGLLELSIFERDRRLVGDGFEQAQVVPLEVAALAKPVDDRQRSEHALLANEGADHRLADMLMVSRPATSGEGVERMRLDRGSDPDRIGHRDVDRDHGLLAVESARGAAQGGVHGRIGEQQESRRVPPGTSAGRARAAPRSQSPSSGA